MQRPFNHGVDLDDVAEAVLNLEAVPDRRLDRDRITSIGRADVFFGSISLQVIDINFVRALEGHVSFRPQFLPILIGVLEASRLHQPIDLLRRTHPF